jgi:hypothetical protein
MRWAGHVARIGESSSAYRVFVVGLRKRDHVEDLGVDGRIFKKWNVEHGLDRAGSGQGELAGFCECCVEPPSSIKCGEFFD